MISLCEFKFSSSSIIDDNKSELNFIAKGYKKYRDDEIIYYFKYENQYKYTIKKDVLVIEVNDSKYTFRLNCYTKAYVKSNEYCFELDLLTEYLMINENKIEIKYSIDFNSFKGSYHIILELL